jgi:hypothetical protein
MRIGHTTVRDEKELSKMENMMATMGTEFWALFPEGTDIEVVESTKGDAFNVYDKRVDRANSELSKLIIGQTMTIEDGSSLSQSQTHLEVFQNLVEFYISRQLGVDTGLMAYKYCRLKNGAECKTTIGGKLNCLTCGDVYPDGNITVVDATSVQKYVVGIVKFGKTQLFNSDVNHDGEISVVDATLIQKYIVGLS